MSKKIHLVVAVMAIFALTATAAQAQEMTMSLGAPSLLKRVAIIQPVTMSCSGFDPSLVVWTESVNVSVEQAAGRQIAHGSALGGPSPLFGCDGTQNTFSVVISADSSGPPFHGGSAVVTANGSVGAANSCGPGCAFAPFESAFASSGPTSEKLG